MKVSLSNCCEIYSIFIYLRYVEGCEVLVSLYFVTRQLLLENLMATTLIYRVIALGLIELQTIILMLDRKKSFHCFLNKQVYQ